MALTLSQAAQLCSTGEWVSDLEAIGHIVDQARTLTAQFGSAESAQRQWLRNSAFYTVFAEAHDALSRILLERVDHQVILEPHHLADLARIELRITPGAVLKVGPALEEIGKLLASVFAALTLTPLSLVLGAAYGLQVWAAFKRLVECWETIHDPHERLVFEAVFRLEGNRSAEFLHLSSQPAALRLLESDVEGICASVGPALTEREVFQALRGLKDRRILVERDSRWSIAF